MRRWRRPSASGRAEGRGRRGRCVASVAGRGLVDAGLRWPGACRPGAARLRAGWWGRDRQAGAETVPCAPGLGWRLRLPTGCQAVALTGIVGGSGAWPKILAPGLGSVPGESTIVEAALQCSFTLTGIGGGLGARPRILGSALGESTADKCCLCSAVGTKWTKKYPKVVDKMRDFGDSTTAAEWNRECRRQSTRTTACED